MLISYLVQLSGEGFSRDCSALTCSLGVGDEVVFKALALRFVEVEPALGHEGVRVGENFWVDVDEDGGHADDCLGKVRKFS